MTYSKQTWVDGVDGGTPITAARLAHLEDGIDAAQVSADAKAPLTGVEAVVFHDGSAGGGTRPTGYARVRWVGGTARPTNMLANDVWEHDA